MKETDAIHKEVKHILKRFGKDLEVFGSEKTDTSHDPKMSGGFREVAEGTQGDDAFRKRFFANAPKTSQTGIIAEKGNW